MGKSNGDREYWIDPAKDGKHLKVFCDMTTDGGKMTKTNSLSRFAPLLRETAPTELFCKAS